MACRMLDADPRQMRVTAGEIVIPRGGGGESDIVIPLAPPRVSTAGVHYAALMDIPWFGGRDWETMYDWPAHRTSKQHLPINYVWDACVVQSKIAENNASADDAICYILQLYAPDQLKSYLAAPPAP